MPCVPERGDYAWVSFDPQAGHEQAGRRPALILSALDYNRPSGLCLVCPATTRAKGYPFELIIPAGEPVTGVLLADQVRNVDWRARNTEYIGRASPRMFKDVRWLIEQLLRDLPTY